MVQTHFEADFMFSAQMIRIVFAVAALVATASGAAFDASIVTQPCGTATMVPGDRLIIQTPNYPANYNVNDRFVSAIKMLADHIRLIYQDILNIIHKRKI